MKVMKLSNYILLLIVLLFVGCSEDYLDKKPNKSLVIPSTLEDLQALLDNSTSIMNVVPALGVISSDDLFTTDAGWQAYGLATERNSYTWSADIYSGETTCGDWNFPYQQVFYANVVLEGLNSIDTTLSNVAQWKAIKGSALFYRAHAFYQLAQLFAPAYDHTNASITTSIPLRLTADVNAPVVRSKQSETYNQIIKDLEEAEPLLPLKSAYKTRPTQNASVALLSRVYLTIEDYEEAEYYADLSIKQSGYLLNYNNLTASATRPIPAMNDEVLFYGATINYSFISSTLTYVDTTLYSTYSTDDLRKTVFFRLRSANRYTFKAHYTGTSLMFGGIANDEIYLNRAESRLRNGNTNGALEDLNALLSTRWKTGKYIPVVETDPEILLNIILTERRKELLFRGNRWTDLRRLNKDRRFTQTLSRKLNGTIFTLPPNDLKYVYPIPFQEISASGIEQNPR
ncbi:MAG: RagB/SusD family nutrient uptake outer membrane protein [Azospira oryzae]|nr:MAG: RagB/SusD family nutrient uptake outer membrane protein [Azospira oryzae]